jgi:hypothetical protein
LPWIIIFPECENSPKGKSWSSSAFFNEANFCHFSKKIALQQQQRIFNFFLNDLNLPYFDEIK